MNVKRILSHLVDTHVRAGFPGVVEQVSEEPLDLNEHLVTNSTATFFVRVDGDSMIKAGIHTGDTLIVDRSIEAHHNDIVVATLDGAFTVKRLYKTRGVLRLIPENPLYRPITITDSTDFAVWGVVTWVLHKTYHSKLPIPYTL